MHHPYDRRTIRATIAQWMREEVRSDSELHEWLASADGKEAVDGMFTTTLGRIYNSAHAQYLTSAVLAVSRSTRSIVGHVLQEHSELATELKRLEGIVQASQEVVRAPEGKTTESAPNTP